MKLRCAIIVCTKNRKEDLAITLQSVFQQSILPDALIIVDDSTGDETEKFIRDLTVPASIPIQYIHSHPPHAGLPAARNTGIRHVPASADLVLFLDDDVSLDSGYLESILMVFDEDPALTGTCGLITGESITRPVYQKILRLLVGFFNPFLVPATLYRPTVSRTAEAMAPLFIRKDRSHVPARWLSGCNMAYRITIFSDGDLFDENLIRYALGEDMIFSHTLFLEGKKLVMVYDARLEHRSSPSNRIMPVSRLMMTLGYRRYALGRFCQRRWLRTLYYDLFLIQFMTAMLVLSLKNYRNLSHFRNAILACNTVRKYRHDLAQGDLRKFNLLLSDGTR